MECKQKQNMNYCNCTYSCSRHGICCECLHYHRRMGELPACYFSDKDERTYNRSVDFYMRTRK